jgi:hypothetical protein
MAKLCLDCRYQALMTDLVDETDSVYYCSAHQIVLAPVRLNSPACAQAWVGGGAPPARKKARSHSESIR